MKKNNDLEKKREKTDGGRINGHWDENHRNNIWLIF